MPLFTTKKTKETIEEDLKQYEGRRKLEIDVDLSEYRRQEKNRAIEDVKTYQDTRVEIAQARAKEADVYSGKKLAKETELAQLDGEITARKAIEETQKAHRKLTEEARQAKSDAEITAAKNEAKLLGGTIEYLKTLVTTLMTAQGKSNEEVVKALTVALGRDHSTKVIGLGIPALNAEPAKSK